MSYRFEIQATCALCGETHVEVARFAWRVVAALRRFRHWAWMHDGAHDQERVQMATDADRLGETTDPTDPRLGHGSDTEPVPQNAAYLVLSDAERARGFIRPVRRSYVHNTCGAVTTMSQAIAETYARQPSFYGSTYCVHCRMHRPVGEFVWDGTDQAVGS